MALITVTVTERLEIPDDAEIAYAPTGVVSGFRLKDGRIVKPWVSYEIEEDDETNHDLSHDEMQALGIEAGLDYERHIDRV